MSTKISDLSPTYGPHTLESLPDERVNFCVLNLNGTAMITATMDRAELLAAISSELGVVIIDQADMPIVTERGVPDAVFVGDTPWHRGTGWDVAAIRKSALDRLALADYLERNPPVDEAQVKALAEIVRAATDTPADAYIGADLTAEGIARRLVATGKVEVRS